MSALREFSTAVEAADEWVDDLMGRLGWHDRERVYLALAAALRALRDCLARDEAVYLGAYLPPLLRGFYYEGWHPGRRAAVKSKDAFLERIQESVHRDPAIDAEQVARAVFALLSARVRAGELEDVKAATPQPLHPLWPD